MARSSGVGTSTLHVIKRTIHCVLLTAHTKHICAMQYGMGARSSGVVGGTSTLHRQLEEGLAELKGTQDCLLTPTGGEGERERKNVSCV